MGQFLEGHPRQPPGPLTPTVRACHNLHVPVPPAFSLAPPYPERRGPAEQAESIETERLKKSRGPLLSAREVGPLCVC